MRNFLLGLNIIILLSFPIIAYFLHFKPLSLMIIIPLLLGVTFSFLFYSFLKSAEIKKSSLKILKQIPDKEIESYIRNKKLKSL